MRDRGISRDLQDLFDALDRLSVELTNDLQKDCYQEVHHIVVRLVYGHQLEKIKYTRFRD